MMTSPQVSWLFFEISGYLTNNSMLRLLRRKRL
jgi:hypothetical protein